MTRRGTKKERTCLKMSSRSDLREILVSDMLRPAGVEEAASRAIMSAIVVCKKGNFDERGLECALRLK